MMKSQEPSTLSNQILVRVPMDATQARMHDHLAAVVEASEDVICALTLQGVIASWNPAGARICGYSAAEIVGHPFTQIVPAGSAPEFEQALTQLRRGEPVRPFETNCLTKSSDRLDVSVQILPIRDSAGTVQSATLILRDLTTQKQAERGRQQLHAIAAAINTSQDLDAILRQVRDAAVEAGGFDRAGVFRVEGERVYGSWGTDGEGNVEDSHAFVEILADWGPPIDTLTSGMAHFYIEEFPADCRPEGFEKTSFAHAVVALRADGELMGLLSVDNLLSGRPVVPETVLPLLPFAEQAAIAIRNARLLSERARHLERQRRLSSLAAAICASSSLSDILRMVRDAIVDAGGFDRAGVFLYDPECNALRGTWGTDRAGGLEDISYQEYALDPDSQAPMLRVARGELDYALSSDFTESNQIGAGDPMVGVRAHAVLALRANDLFLGVVAVDNLLGGAPIHAEDIQGLLPFAELAAVAIANSRLFQELRQAQEALIRTEKLRAVGELASGIAHNINNILTAVLGYAELIRTTPDLSPEIAYYARTVERAASDGADIVRRMQHFASMETSAQKTRFNLADVAQEALQLVRPAWQTQAVERGVKIAAEIRLDTPLWVRGVASELREVIVNLVTNALHAMPDGGTLTIRGLTENGKAVIEVRDTGVGMAEPVYKRIFEPFFTTKGPSLGTGLGLSVAWGIVNQHQGRIDVQSALGEGSVFRVVLPLADPSAPLP